MPHAHRAAVPDPRPRSAAGRKRRIGSGLCSRVALASAAALLLSARIAAAQPPVAGTAGGARVIDRRVALPDGRRFKLVCEGQGGPTLVFLQGAGSQIRDWGAVGTAATRMTRSCFYDRAGYGFSDPPRAPMTLSTVVEDLRALLKAAGVPPPYVLVGHSLGGLYATFYEDRHPDEVAGLVLVDPAFAGAFEFPRSHADDLAFASLVEQTFTTAFRCLAAAREGKLTPAEPRDCFVPPPATSPDASTFAALFTTPGLYEAELLEIEATSPIGAAAPPDVVEERQAARTFGALPMIVLTAGDHAPLPGLSAEANRIYLDGWRRGHAALAARSSAGASEVVAGASHFIQIDHPKTVIDAITKVLARARTVSALPPN